MTELEQTKADLAQLRKEFTAVKELAEALGVGFLDLKREHRVLLAEYDEIRSTLDVPSNKLKDWHMVAIEYTLAGRTQQEIADKVGLSRQSVSKFMTKPETKLAMNRIAAEQSQLDLN